MGQADARKIIHVDMDAFYASVEQRDDPVLRGRPVAVGHAAKRGVVAAASYEARTFGVRSAMPSTTALRKCPDLVFVPPRFEIYRAISHQIRSIFADYTSLIEPLSLDEAYLDVTENLRGIPSASATAAEIRARIFGETGLTASAGISYNKFLAKLASDRHKPNGQFVITPGTGAAFVEVLPVSKFHGVGPATAHRMNRLGIFTGADLRRQSLAFLQQHFGTSSNWREASPSVRRLGHAGEPERNQSFVGRMGEHRDHRLSAIIGMLSAFRRNASATLTGASAPSTPHVPLCSV
jgi:DNA polymerase-4